MVLGLDGVLHISVFLWFVVVFWWSPGELLWVCVTWNWKLWLVCDLVVVYCFFLLHNRIQVYILVQLSIYDINVFWFFWLDWACLLVCWLCFIFKCLRNVIVCFSLSCYYQSKWFNTSKIWIVYFFINNFYIWPQNCKYKLHKEIGNCLCSDLNVLVSF